MNEKLKFMLLLIVLILFAVFETAYIILQASTYIKQKNTTVKVFAKGMIKLSSVFSLIVGILMVYTFIVSDSFIYNNSADRSENLMKLGYRPWHFVYTLGKVAGVLIIIAAVISFFNRFAVDKDYIITDNGKRISSDKCMAAKSGNIVTVTYAPGGVVIPSVLFKFVTDSESGKKAYDIIQENYKTL